MWFGPLGGCWNRGMARNRKDPLGRYLWAKAEVYYPELLEELRQCPTNGGKHLS